MVDGLDEESKTEKKKSGVDNNLKFPDFEVRAMMSALSYREREKKNNGKQRKREILTLFEWEGE